MFGLEKREYKKSIQLNYLDELVVNAAFSPAEGWYEIDMIHWKAGTDSRTFLSELLTLSEFYERFNPVLSSALWGIWNTAQYLERVEIQRSFWVTFGGRSEKRRKQDFHDYRALVATAVVHFSDGTPQTSITNPTYGVSGMDMGGYQTKAMKAIKILESIVWDDD